jgi:hypothetical protein
MKKGIGDVYCCGLATDVCVGKLSSQQDNKFKWQQPVKSSLHFGAVVLQLTQD